MTNFCMRLLCFFTKCVKCVLILIDVIEEKVILTYFLNDYNILPKMHPNTKLCQFVSLNTRDYKTVVNFKENQWTWKYRLEWLIFLGRLIYSGWCILTSHVGHSLPESEVGHKSILVLWSVKCRLSWFTFNGRLYHSHQCNLTPIRWLCKSPYISQNSIKVT